MSAKYAQHFLVDSSAVERIVDALHLDENQAVLEIGPGRGVLTGEILKRCGRLVAVEVDPKMQETLTRQWGKNPAFELIRSDILRFDLRTLGGGPFIVAGNLPYNLTSPILRKLSGWDNWTRAVVMVQKEVGERLSADVGTPEYGALTVGMALTCEIKSLFDLGPRSFRPPPKVESRVLELTRRPVPLTTDIEGTQKVIQAAFQQRRKTILNSLSHGLGIPKKIAGELLQSTGVPETVRPERIPVEIFIQIAKKLTSFPRRRESRAGFPIETFGNDD